mmetsp:Transcript_34603/g.62714  ORF Transcript_34603/g.62714 Transcript_34603/m.62714 type:complete len:749 (+) Transcript_34603:71-2317(+)|eukprot:CAMPEP_0197657606 /NCGR_PEP_ID=MMETSP1338-20131121/44731_1 /TAXON_ID=43686 ORGANISM="Pelagodinium beii, Strain RCC1491" /NCGR_SAMPLE_ID=MMETSP1338 /ASSEMBLY_ACC=CAM_ASM_000754 /LENGTH=748 /DNA_ID=CAMNT_0043234019 /DNA_START=71 /DNA_END=2320 /DNA_ORIENTATION=-
MSAGDDDEEAVVDEEVLNLLRFENSVPGIESAADKYKGLARTLVGKKDQNAVRKDLFEKAVVALQAKNSGCLSLPFSVAMFMIYGAAVMAHEEITSVYMIESGLGGALADGADDISDIGSIWSWLEGSLVPSLFTQADSQGVPYENKTDWGRVLTYNYVTGPVVIEQFRSERAYCYNGEGILGDMLCWSQWKPSTATFGLEGDFPIKEPEEGVYAGTAGNITIADRKAYYDSAFSPVSTARRLARDIRPEYDSKLPDGEGKDFFVVPIFPNTPIDLVYEHLNYLKQKEWIDASTNYIRVKALLVNAEMGRPRLENFVFNLAFSRAGGIWKRIQLDNIFLRTHANTESVVLDVLFLACMAFSALTELNLLRKAFQQKQVRKHVTRLWTFLQFTILGLGGVVIFGFLVQFRNVGSIVESFETVVADQLTDIPADFNTAGVELTEKADSYRSTNANFRFFTGTFTLILMIRMFAAFGAQPKLAVVTKSLEAAAFDIIHFLCVLVPTALAYALAGGFVFGRRMEEFATIDASVGYVFKLIIEGEFDWPYYSEENFWTAGAWMWSFMILMNMIMINMVLAIVLDTYSATRLSNSGAETVGTTMWNLLTQAYNYKVWVRADDLLKALPELPDEILREDLLAKFPTMCDAQVDLLFNDTLNEEASEANMTADSPVPMKLALSCKLALDDVQEYVQLLHGGNMEESGVEAQSTPVWVDGLAKEVGAQNLMLLNLQQKLESIEWQFQALEALNGAEA